MVDVQSLKDNRNINIQKVGVKGIKYPIIVLDKANGTQHVNADINMYVNLPHRFKGTHMSRFVEILNEYRGQINIKTFQKILGKMKGKAQRRIRPYRDKISILRGKTAPVSNAKSLMEYKCSFCGESNNEKNDFLVGITVPVTTVCPCSKE